MCGAASPFKKTQTDLDEFVKPKTAHTALPNPATITKPDQAEELKESASSEPQDCERDSLID
ncbi:MAG: hypothetical protein ACK54Y_09750 [Bacteroidota bacterium]